MHGQRRKGNFGNSESQWDITFGDELGFSAMCVLLFFFVVIGAALFQSPHVISLILTLSQNSGTFKVRVTLEIVF